MRRKLVGGQQGRRGYDKSVQLHLHRRTWFRVLSASRLLATGYLAQEIRMAIEETGLERKTRPVPRTHAVLDRIATSVETVPKFRHFSRRDREQRGQSSSSFGAPYKRGGVAFSRHLT